MKLSGFVNFADSDFCSKIGFIELRNDSGANPEVSGLEYDSRKIQAGSLYFALTGLHTDGHRFIDQALEKGASVIVHQNDLPEYKKNAVYIKVKDSRFAMSPVSASFYGFPAQKQKMTLIGVTGTEGKSTTVYLIWQLLKLAGKKAGFISTVQYCTADAEEWNPEHQTTPEAPVIHKKLAEMRENGLEFAVLEASSHGLSPRTNRLGDIAFDAGVMTNVTHEHLEFHGTWEQYRDDKANLFRSFSQFSPDKREKKFGIVNADDKSADFFAKATEYPVFSYGIEKGDLRIEKLESGARGNSYHMRENGQIFRVEDKLPGAFNAKNVCAALLCVSKLLDIPLQALIPLVLRLKPVRGRMTAVQKGQAFEVLIDYAHTPSSFETIFPPLRERLDKDTDKKRKIISVFGSAGERDTQKRPEQGRIAALYSDILVLTDEDPRGEEPLDILKEIAAGAEKVRPFHEGEDIFLIPDRPSAIRKAFSLAKAEDLVLLLGKGHENSIIYKHETKKFDEIATAEQALAEIFPVYSPNSLSKRFSCGSSGVIARACFR